MKLLSILISFIFLVCSESDSCNNSIEEPVMVTLNPYVGRLVTAKAVVGADTLQLLLDTGGGETFIIPDVARRLGCKPSGRGIGYRMNGEPVTSQYCYNITLTIGEISFHHEMIGVWDINSVLPEELPPLDGLLSLKTFQNQPFTLDLASKCLTLETKYSLDDRVRNMTRLKSRIATGPSGSEMTIFLHGKLREYGWFLLDSGNLDVVLVSPHLDFNRPIDSTKTSDVWEAELNISNLSPKSTRCRTKDIIYDGALSEEFMSDWIFTFDLSSNAVWVTPVDKSQSN